MRYIRRNELVSRSIGGELFVVPTAGKLADLQQVFSMNASGVRMWDVLERPADAGDLAAALVEAFDVTPERARADAEAFLHTLVERGLVQEVGEHAVSGD